MKIQEKGTLYIVALPIGDMSDITLHALDVLKSVEVIAAEDTRVTKELLRFYKIDEKRLFSHHNHNEKESSKGVIQLLQQKKDVALVSDAGTPGISDPGYCLVSDAQELGIPIVAVPGPSSLSAALSLCPIGGSSHYFGAFAPNTSKERKALFEKVKNVAHRIVFFESPHRLVEHLTDAAEFFTQTCVMRELTKTYQEVVFQSTKEVLAHFIEKPPRGEIVVIHKGESGPLLSAAETGEEIERLLSQGLSSQDVLDKLQAATSLTRKELYKVIQEKKNN